MNFSTDNYKDEDIKIENITNPFVFTYIDLCSGIGGFHQGIDKITDLPSKCILACDVDKNCRKTYYMNYNIPCHKDITKLDLNIFDNVRVDAVFGGFPCQPFSQSGLRRGVEDTRGTIIYHIFKIIQKTNPKYILLENVAGILEPKHSDLINTIQSVMDELGYRVNIQKSNPLWIGIPHDRVRVMFSCVRLDVSLSKWANIQQPIDKKPNYTPLWDLLDKTDTKNNLITKHKKIASIAEQYSTTPCPSKPKKIFLKFLDCDLDKISKTNQQIVKKNLQLYQNDNNFKQFIDTLLSKNNIDDLTQTQLLLEFDEKTINLTSFNKIILQPRQSGVRIKQNDYSPTLTKSGYRLIVVYEDIIRYLNDKELLQLQSFSADFKYISSPILQQQIGNSVNCKVVEQFLRRMID